MGLKFIIPQTGLAGTVGQLMSLDHIAKSATKTISQARYDKFCNEFIFQTLRTGDQFGLAFCKKFKIMDYILIMSKNMEEAKRYIDIAKYVRPKVIK
jgi:hypothetical protein